MTTSKPVRKKHREATHAWPVHFHQCHWMIITILFPPKRLKEFPDKRLYITHLLFVSRKADRPYLTCYPWTLDLKKVLPFLVENDDFKLRQQHQCKIRHSIHHLCTHEVGWLAFPKMGWVQVIYLWCLNFCNVITPWISMTQFKDR